MNSVRLAPTERVYQQLKNDVITMNFGLGYRLTINELADRYFVSATPVREALCRLHGEDMVDFKFGHGYYCKSPTLWELQELFDLVEVVVLACLSKCSSLTTGLQLEPRIAFGGDHVALDRDDGQDPFDLRCAASLCLIEGLVERCGTTVSLNLVRRIHARLHFIVRRAFMDHCSAERLRKGVDQICQAMNRRDLLCLETSISDYYGFILERLPTLLSNYVSEQYVGSP